MYIIIIIMYLRAVIMFGNVSNLLLYVLLQTLLYISRLYVIIDPTCCISNIFI